MALRLLEKPINNKLKDLLLIQGLPGLSALFNLPMSDRNMQVRFDHKGVLEY